MKTQVEGFEWNVCPQTKEVSVVVKSFQECEELLKKKYLLRELYALWGKEHLLKALESMGMLSMPRYLILKWIERDFPMVIEVEQTLDGWLIPWIPNPFITQPLVCSLEDVLKGREVYECLSIGLKFILMEGNYVW